MTYFLALIGAITVFGWIRSAWRTRKDKGYDARKWGAY
jgi:hypothetical protein